MKSQGRIPAVADALVIIFFLAALCLPLLLFQVITGGPPYSATRAEAATALAVWFRGREPTTVRGGVGPGGVALYRWPARPTAAQLPRRVASDVP